jgi:hypothetical protein
VGESFYVTGKNFGTFTDNEAVVKYVESEAGGKSQGDVNHIQTSDGVGGFKDSGAFFFAAGDLGIEYNFEEAPIQLSLDIRPELYFNSDNYRDDNFGPDLALGIRYRF